MAEAAKTDDAIRNLVGQTAAAQQEAALRANLAKELEEVRALKAKLEMQTTIRTEVVSAFEEERRRKEFGKLTPAMEPPMPPKPDEALVAMRLERNYRPGGYYEVVGYTKEAVFKKFPDGQTREVEPSQWISGEKKPPQIAGVGTVGKIWAGTVLRVPQTEARVIQRAGIGVAEIEG